MATSCPHVDDPVQLQRFLTAMNFPSTTRSTPPTSASQTAEDASSSVTFAESPTSLVTDGIQTPPNETATLTSDASRSRVGSESLQVTPSPRLGGLLPPQNTPQTMPHSPRPVPISDSTPEESEDGPIIFNIVSSPHETPSKKSASYQPTFRSSLSKVSSGSSSDLTVTKVAEYDDSINDSYERMSFKAADPSLDGKTIAGDRVPRNPFIKSSTSKALTSKLEALQEPCSLLEGRIISREDSADEKKPLKGIESFAPRLGQGIDLSANSCPHLGANTDTMCFKSPQGSLHLGNRESQSFNDAEGLAQTASETSSSPDSEEADSPETHIEDSPQATSTSLVRPSKADFLPPHLAYQRTPKTNELARNEVNDAGMARRKENKGEENAPTVTVESDATPAKRVHSSSSLVPPKSPPNGTRLDKKSSSTTDEPQLENSISTGAPQTAEHVVGSDEVAEFTTDNIKEPPTVASAGASIDFNPLEKANAGSTDEHGGNLEEKLFFQQWPKMETRDRPSAQVRTVILTRLPASATPSFVVSLVFGGPLEYIRVNSPLPGSDWTTALIRFLHPADCTAFYNATSNGLVYQQDRSKPGKDQYALVEIGADVDVIGGLLGQWIQAGVTRCVRAVPVGPEYGREYLWKIGERKDRKLESLEDGRVGKNKSRFVTWRFCDIKHAVQFKAALARDEDWEICNVTYADDPCSQDGDASG